MWKPHGPQTAWYSSINIIYYAKTTYLNSQQTITHHHTKSLTEHPFQESSLPLPGGTERPNGVRRHPPPDQNERTTENHKWSCSSSKIQRTTARIKLTTFTHFSKRSRTSSICYWNETIPRIHSLRTPKIIHNKDKYKIIVTAEKKAKMK